MLARRFTIVCLLTMLFGMGFAELASRSGRTGNFDEAARTAPVGGFLLTVQKH